MDGSDAVQLKRLATATALQLSSPFSHLYISRQIASRKNSSGTLTVISSDARQISRQS